MNTRNVANDTDTSVEANLVSTRNAANIKWAYHDASAIDGAVGAG